MIVLALVVLVVCAVIGAVVRRSRRASLSIPVSLKDLIDRALVAVRSLDSEMDSLRESFRPSAYMGVGGRLPWTAENRARLLERLDHVKMCFGRMDCNVLTFENLGQLALAYTMGQDMLALEIATKAAGCKLELRHLRRRIMIYDLVPVSMWRLLGRKLAYDCLYSGNDLIQQYRTLAERVLVFARARGETYQYESLMSAL